MPSQARAGSPDRHFHRFLAAHLAFSASLAVTSFVALRRIHLLSGAEAPLSSWLAPWNLNSAAACIFCASIFGFAWSVVRGTLARVTAVLAAVIVASFIDVLLTQSSPPAAHAFFDMRIARLAESAVVVLEAGILAFVLQLVMAHRDSRNRDAERAPA